MRVLILALHANANTCLFSSCRSAQNAVRQSPVAGTLGLLTTLFFTRGACPQTHVGFVDVMAAPTEAAPPGDTSAAFWLLGAEVAPPYFCRENASLNLKWQHTCCMSRHPIPGHLTFVRCLQQLKVLLQPSQLVWKPRDYCHETCISFRLSDSTQADT